MVEEDGEKKYVYLLDEDMKIETIGKVSVNLAEKALAVAVNTTFYRKGAEEITNTTNETISHEGLKDIVLKVGEKMEEKEEIELYDKEKIVKGTKEIVALFEEADGLCQCQAGALCGSCGRVGDCRRQAYSQEYGYWRAEPCYARQAC